MICTNCKENETIIKEGEKEFNVKGKKIKIKYKYRFCNKCNVQIYDEELDQETTKKLMREYHKKYGIEPQKIINFRKKYNLSQELFSKIIGCAKKTLISYEKGTSIPNDSYMIILKTIIENEKSIKPIIEANKEQFSNIEYSKIEKNIYNKIGNNIKTLTGKEIELSTNNGYTNFNFEKLKSVISILTKNGIHKTKLLKELFYIDFSWYKENECSMTGLEYARINYGPVPDNYEIILSKLYDDNLITLNETYNGNYQEDIILLNRETEINNLTQEEKKLIDKIKKYFEKFSVKEIVQFSHNEKAYIETQPKEIISYDYSFDLQI